ncbi:hypothetical protein ABZS88_45000 [Streptomyces sp. NPDC005480]
MKPPPHAMTCPVMWSNSGVHQVHGSRVRLVTTESAVLDSSATSTAFS